MNDMNESARLNELDSFRLLWDRLRTQEVSDSFMGTIMTVAPTGIEQLFKRFLEDPRVTKEDITHLLVVLTNTDSHMWDEIAHMFL